MRVGRVVIVVMVGQALILEDIVGIDVRYEHLITLADNLGDDGADPLVALSVERLVTEPAPDLGRRTVFGRPPFHPARNPGRYRPGFPRRTVPAIGFQRCS